MTQAIRYRIHLACCVALLSAPLLLVTPAQASLFEALLGLFAPRAVPALNERKLAPPAWHTSPQQSLPIPYPSGGGRSGPAYCVRLCDGLYFPVQARGGLAAHELCHSFCPASQTEVFFGSKIDGATNSEGRRYPDIKNAFAYRNKLKATCTCNGRSPVGLAAIDIAADATLRRGDIISTTAGLVAYTGNTRHEQLASFTPLDDYKGKGSKDLRWQLRGVKIAPVAAELATERMLISDPGDDLLATPRKQWLPQASIHKPRPELAGLQQTSENLRLPRYDEADHIRR